MGKTIERFVRAVLPGSGGIDQRGGSGWGSNSRGQFDALSANRFLQRGSGLSGRVFPQGHGNHLMARDTLRYGLQSSEPFT